VVYDIGRVTVPRWRDTRDPTLVQD
jgi:hypothetical protein